MRKIPTLFRRDPDRPALITREVHPDCTWVLDGEGHPTRKYDGTCVGHFLAVAGVPRIHEGVGSSDIDRADDLSGVWLARREVKPGKPTPDGFIPEETDPATGKTVGWEPIAQSSFAKVFNEALPRLGCSPYLGTYELCGPKVNGNPEKFAVHSLVRHYDAEKLKGVPLEFDDLLTWLLHQRHEGIVWHHADGRMAKLKVRDAHTYIEARNQAEES